MLEEKKITIEVPASTGNVGPGFDCIGLAVDIWNKVTIETVSYTHLTLPTNREV